MTVRREIEDSARDFKNIVFPEIKHMLVNEEYGCEWASTEACFGNRMATLLDIKAGVDSLIYGGGTGFQGIRFIATRVQWGITYRTFTIRKERFDGRRTEYEKYCSGIEHSFVYPYWFIQAYLTEKEGRLLEVGIAKVEDIVECIQREPEWLSVKKGPDAYFYVIPWDEFELGWQRGGIRLDYSDSAL